MKQRDQRRAKVIKVHQIVQPWCKVIIGLFTVGGQLAAVEELSENCEDKEYGVERAKHGQGWGLKLLVGHHDDLELFELTKHVQ